MNGAATLRALATDTVTVSMAEDDQVLSLSEVYGVAIFRGALDF